MNRRRVDAAGGFTLIELLISISITIVILSSISTALMVFLSNGKYTMKRDDHNAAAVLLSSYLDRDFASATTAVAASASTCTSATTVLTLGWRDYTATAAAPTPVAASYYGSKYVVSSDTADDLGDATCKLSRVFAKGADIDHLTTAISTEVLVRNMPANAFAAAFSGTCGGGTAVTASLAQYSSDNADSNYTYRGCVNVRQTS